MSRKDFILIAATIRNAPLDCVTRSRLAIDFADSLRLTNERFDRSRFLRACVSEARP